MNFAFLEAAVDGGLFGGIGMWVVLIGMFVVMYFIMIRPQKKKEKQATEMRNSIEIGDEVTTIGGIVGRVVTIKEDTFVLETAGDRSRMRFRRWAIQEVGKLSLDSEAPAATPETPKADKKDKKAEKNKDK